MEFENVKKIISNVLDMDVEDILNDSDLVEDLGCDSLDRAEIIMAIEDEFDIKLEESLFEHIVTVSDVLEVIRQFLD